MRTLGSKIFCGHYKKHLTQTEKYKGLLAYCLYVTSYLYWFTLGLFECYLFYNAYEMLNVLIMM